MDNLGLMRMPGVAGQRRSGTSIFTTSKRYRIMKKTLLAAALGLSFAMPQAEAALFNLHYDAFSGTLDAVIDGALQGDNNTVIVNSVQDFATWNGVPGISLPFVSSLDVLLGISGGALPTLTLDGSFLDFIACDGVNCGDGFAFGVGNGFDTLSRGPVYNPGNSFGTALEGFNAAGYSFTPAGIVPELDTAGAPLALAWLAGLLALSRRKAA
jgi:hypothetical protein